MADAIRLMQKPFLDRLEASRAWSLVGYAAPRWLLALVLALVPALLLVAAAALGPDELGRAITEPENVHGAFSEFVDAVASAAAIAVSVAVLALGREIKGIGRQRKRQEDALAYRDEVRRASGRESAPLALGPFLAMGLTALRDQARRARRVATREELQRERDGVRLGEFLDVVEGVSERLRGEVLRTRRRPDRLARAALDFEEEVTSHYARLFARMDGVGADLAGALEDVVEGVNHVITGAKYAKSLDLQWGLSRMSIVLALTSLPAILAAAVMVLTYGQGAVDALGVLGAAGLVGAALAVVVLPLACFVSYILRFVFLNEHSLPADSFVLGPEEWEVAEGEGDGTPGPRRRGRPGPGA